MALLLGFVSGAWGERAVAVDILDTAEHVFFDPSISSRVWVKIGSSDVVFGPVTAADLGRLEKALPVSDSSPVRTQVLVEAAPPGGSGVEIKDLLNLLKTYFYTDHQNQVRDHLHAEGVKPVPGQKLSRGMMARLLDASYKPNLSTFISHYFYRQALELSGERRAWSLPLKTVRAKVLADVPLRVLASLEAPGLRIASLLEAASPGDPLVARLREAGALSTSAEGGAGVPVIEFEHLSLKPDPVAHVKRSLGLVEGARKYGYYDHDWLMQELSGLDVETIQRLRKAVNKDNRQGNVIFRYFSADPTVIDGEAKAEYRRVLGPYYRDTRNGVVGFLDPASGGVAPLFFPGVVFHRLSHHKTSIRGIYNPGLVNEVLHDALANKWVEFKFWEEYAPGAMPETIQLSELLERKGLPVETVLQRLNRRFPYGWVVKPIWGFGSETAIITDKTNIVKEVSAYLESDFDEFYRDVKPYFKGEDPQYLTDYLKNNHDNYLGWQIHKMLKMSPELFIVQRRMPIEREFRVEIWGGKVLGGRSTIDRYRYRYLYEEHMGRYVAPTREEIARVEEFAQKLVDRLPPEFRETPFAMDVALLWDGGIQIVESNPGGNSMFLAESDEEPGGILKIGKFLQEYPKRVQRGELKGGMTSVEQMQYLKRIFEKWRIDPKKMYDGVTFTEEAMIDPEYKTRKADPGNYRASPSKRCIQLLLPKASR